MPFVMIWLLPFSFIFSVCLVIQKGPSIFWRNKVHHGGGDNME